MKKLYRYYIGIGLLYVLVKILFVSFGYLHLGAILHGLIPSIITILTGLIALRHINTNNGKSILLARIALVLPILIFITTPVYMYLKAGADMWLTNGRSQVLVIYELLAILQFAIAYILLKRLNHN